MIIIFAVCGIIRNKEISRFLKRKEGGYLFVLVKGLIVFIKDFDSSVFVCGILIESVGRIDVGDFLLNSFIKDFGVGDIFFMGAKKAFRQKI